MTQRFTINCGYLKVHDPPSPVSSMTRLVKRPHVTLPELSSACVVRENKSRNLQWFGLKTKAFHTLLGKPHGKTGFGRHRSRWDDNIKTDLLDRF
jgi:hypothetical protein